MPVNQTSQPLSSVSTSPLKSTLKIGKLTQIAMILWIVGFGVFLASIILAQIYIANTSNYVNDLVGLSIILYPIVSSLIWIPLGITSLILVIIARTRHETGKRWGIAVILLTVIPIPAALIFWVLAILIPNGSFMGS